MVFKPVDESRPEPDKELQDINKEKTLIQAQMELDVVKRLRDKPEVLKARERQQYDVQQAQQAKQLELDAKEEMLTEREAGIETIVEERVKQANEEAETRLEDTKTRCNKMVEECQDTIDFKLKNAANTIAKAAELSKQEDRIKEIEEREAQIDEATARIKEWRDSYIKRTERAQEAGDVKAVNRYGSQAGIIDRIMGWLKGGK